MRVAIMALGLLAGAAQAQPVASTGPVVVELFTSQGCSSCPPAEAVLRELATRPEILALSFHVTYWNSMGWTDPYSLDAATARQRQYQRALDIDTIYTPQIVVQGSAEMVGSDRHAVAHAIMNAASTLAQSSGPHASLLRTGSGLNIEIGAGAGHASVLLIGYDSQHRTAVARGENAGRELLEANIVRSVRKLAEWNGSKLSLTSELPAGEHASILLQAPNGQILSAAVAKHGEDG